MITYNALIVFMAEDYNVFNYLTEHKLFVRIPCILTTRIGFSDVILTYLTNILMSLK